MADYSTKFSMCITGPLDTLEFLKRRLNLSSEEEEDSEILKEPWIIDSEYPEIGCSSLLEKEKSGSEVYSLYIYSEGYVSLDNFIQLMVYWTKQFKLEKKVFSFTWSETCSKYRPDAFGGGYCLITNGKSYAASVWEESSNRLRRLKKSDCNLNII